METVLKFFCFAVCNYCVGVVGRDGNKGLRNDPHFLKLKVVCIICLVWRTDKSMCDFFFSPVYYFYPDCFWPIIYNLILETSCLALLFEQYER